MALKELFELRRTILVVAMLCVTDIMVAANCRIAG